MRVEDLVHQLQDYELAVLVSLIAGEHCIITAESDQIDVLEDALERNSTVTVRCNGASLDDVVESMLIDCDPEEIYEDKRRKGSVASTSTVVRRPSVRLPDEVHRKIANIVICRDLDRAENPVQIQILELIRTKRIFSRKSVYSAPENFLIIALIERKSTRSKLNHHLLDYFFFSHKHDEEEQDDADSSSYTSESLSSVVIRKPQAGPSGPALVPPKLLKELSSQAKAINITAEMKRYMSDVIVFLRMHRALAGGISAIATQYFELMVKCLCPLHGQDFVTPSLVNLAAYKIYSHRIRICTPDQDRSVMWGSDKAMVGQLLDQLTPDLIIDSVLSEVTPPH